MTDTAHTIEELIRTAGRRLGAYGYVLTGSISAAEELVQDAIVKVLIRKRSLPDLIAAEYYVRSTMRTMYIDAMRRDTTWRRLVPRIAARDIAADHAATIDDRDDVSRALAGLPLQLRTALVLHYYDDLSVAEAAGVMRVSQGTVKRYLHEGRARMAPLLGEQTLRELAHVMER